jgi:hypothetical protein
VWFKLIHNFTDTTDPLDRAEQVVQFSLQNRTVQCHATIARLHVDGSRVRHQPPQFRSHTFHQDYIVDLVTPPGTAYLGHGSGGSMGQIAAPGTQRICAHIRGASDLVSDEGPTPAATVGIEEIHERNA